MLLTQIVVVLPVEVVRQQSRCRSREAIDRRCRSVGRSTDSTTVGTFFLTSFFSPTTQRFSIRTALEERIDDPTVESPASDSVVGWTFGRNSELTEIVQAATYFGSSSKNET